MIKISMEKVNFCLNILFLKTKVISKFSSNNNSKLLKGLDL